MREVLEEAERRKADDLSRTGHKATLIIAIPTIALIAWAGIFLIRYRANEGAAEAKPVIAARVAGQTPVPKDMAELNAFLPDAMRGGKPVKGVPGDGKLEHHEDLEFAMELLNFGRSRSVWEETKKPSESAVREQHKGGDK